jgi:hypothetical protein
MKLPASIERQAHRLSPSLKPKLDYFIVYLSETGEEPWRPVLSNEVPGWLKDNPEAMGQMANGMIAYMDGDQLFYRAERQARH